MSRGRGPNQTYTVRRTSVRKGHVEQYTITVPRHIAEVIPPGTHFVPELTEEGLLFRRLDLTEAELPAWATGRNEA